MIYNLPLKLQYMKLLSRPGRTYPYRHYSQEIIYIFILQEKLDNFGYAFRKIISYRLDFYSFPPIFLYWRTNYLRDHPFHSKMTTGETG